MFLHEALQFRRAVAVKVLALEISKFALHFGRRVEAFEGTSSHRPGEKVA